MTPRTQSSKAEHTHNTPEKEAVALDNTILRTEVGSTVHGINVADQDDRDEMGICIEPPQYTIGLKRFEQYEHHTAWDRPGGRSNRSGPGDLDLCIYSLRKYLRLAMQGNPSVLVPLYVPESAHVQCTTMGRALVGYRNLIVSRNAGERFLGYLRQQRKRFDTRPGRPELVEKYGWDTKYVSHMVRLGYQGKHLLTEGVIPIPLPQMYQDYCRRIRVGEVPMNDALTEAAALEVALIRLVNADPGTLAVRPEPDREWADNWLSSTYLYHWDKERLI